MEYICQCGCGQVIPPKPRHRTYAPKYILEHYLKLKEHPRFDRMREAKVKERIEPPPGWVPPSGLCECGCGKPTPIITNTRASHDEYNGYHGRYLVGHSRRGKGGETHHLWKGKRRHKGYVLLVMPDHPHATVQGLVYEHRYVYEQSRGVQLSENVVVHHINGVKDDNRPENLIATTRVEHRRVHTLAGEIIGLFLDDRLLAAARQYVREHGTLPDLEALTGELYGTPAPEH